MHEVSKNLFFVIVRAMFARKNELKCECIKRDCKIDNKGGWCNFGQSDLCSTLLDTCALPEGVSS